MALIMDIVGIVVFLGIAVLFSRNRRQINWRAVGVLLALNFVIALFFLNSEVGRSCVVAAADGFTNVVEIAFEGIKFLSADLVPEDRSKMSYFVMALMPILLIVPLFDILTYIGLLPWLVKIVGRGLSFVTGIPRFESFFAIEMMFLGNLEVLAVSTLRLERNRPERNLTLAMMSMSCVAAAIVSAYMTLMPKEYVLTAIPLNIINVLIVTSILNPVVVSKEDDVISTYSGKDKPPFFAFLGNSIVNAGKLALIIAATIVTFISLITLVNKGLALIVEGLSIEMILGYLLFPISWLLGLDFTEALRMGNFMGIKIVANEFVAMLSIKDTIGEYSHHFQAVCTIFSTSFANFGTLGMIIGFFCGLKNDGNKYELIYRSVGYILLSGILVSLLSASIGGLFVW